MKNAISLIIGLLLTLVLCFLYVGIVPANPTYRYSGIAAIVCILFIAGYGKVPVQHQEVIEFLGIRLKSRFKEGPRWLPVGLFNAVDVSAKIKKIDVPPLIEMTSNRVPMKTEASLFYQVENSSIFLNLDEAIVVEGLQSLAQEAIREFIIGHTDKQCLKAKSDMQKLIESNIDNETKNKWGIDIENVDVKTALPSDAILKEYEEDKKKELRINRHTKDAKKIAKATPGLTPSEINNITEVVEGGEKVTKEIKEEKKTLKLDIEKDTIKTAAEAIAMFLPNKKTGETKPDEGD